VIVRWGNEGRCGYAQRLVDTAAVAPTNPTGRHSYFGEFASFTMAPRSFPVPDLRDPAAPMTSLPLKLPPATLEALQDRAAALRCNRGALARTLIVRGLEQLEQATAAQGVA